MMFVMSCPLGGAAPPPPNQYRFNSLREGGGERVTRAYTVEVQTASVFYAQSLILLSLMAVKYGHTR